MIQYGYEQPPRGTRYLGRDGVRAITSVDFTEATNRRYSRVEGKFGESRPKLTDEEFREMNASRFSEKTNFLHSGIYAADPYKRTHDHPYGGKRAREYVKERPNPIASPYTSTTITGNNKRIEPVIFSDEEKRHFWSDGRAAQLRAEAEHFSQMQSVITHLNLPKPGELPPIKIGTKMVPHGVARPEQNFVAGFRGMANAREGIQNPRLNMDAPARQAHGLMQLPFYGKRRNEFGPDAPRSLL
jgi:hypothetical protein